MMTTTWESKDAEDNDVTITVETIWDGSETDAEQAARHAQAILDELGPFPINR